MFQDCAKELAYKKKKLSRGREVAFALEKTPRTSKQRRRKTLKRRSRTSRFCSVEKNLYPSALKRLHAITDLISYDCF